MLRRGGWVFLFFFSVKVLLERFSVWRHDTTPFEEKNQSPNFSKSSRHQLVGREEDFLRRIRLRNHHGMRCCIQNTRLPLHTHKKNIHNLRFLLGVRGGGGGSEDGSVGGKWGCE